VGLRETLARTLGTKLHGCTPYAVQPCNFGADDATSDATCAQLSGSSPSARHATVSAIPVQPHSCTQVASPHRHAPTVATPAQPYRLTRADSDRCHANGWDDAEIAAFTGRMTLFMRRGLSATDADDLAERLTLRDRDGVAQRMCIECGHYRPGRCGDHRHAGLHSPDVGRDLAVMLQHCPGFTTLDLQT
jgi:hypothetical protein